MLLTSPLSSPLKNPVRDVFSPAGSSQSLTAQVQALFAASEPGVWYDPSDMSTLFQDSAGTVPVTAVEQPVGLILDKSGRGNHASQATTTKRPVLKIDAGGCYYLSFDGVDDALSTASIDFTGTDKMTVWAGMNSFTQQNGSQLCTVVLHPDTGFNIFAIYAPAGASNLSFTIATSTSFAWVGSVSTIATNSNAVVAGITDLAARTATLRANGVQLATGTAASGGGNFRAGPLYIGGQIIANRHFNGRLYSLIVRGAQSSLSQIEATELYMKKKVGIA